MDDIAFLVRNGEDHALEKDRRLGRLACGDIERITQRHVRKMNKAWGSYKTQAKRRRAMAAASDVASARAALMPAGTA